MGANDFVTRSCSSFGILSSRQDDESESEDDEDSEDWGSDSVDSGSESEDNEGAASSLAVVFLKK